MGIAIGHDYSRDGCLFCGGFGKRTREHVLRHEFKQHIPEAAGLLFTAVRAGEVEVFPERPMGQFDMTVNAVCAGCNNGWLRDLEDAALASLLRLASDRSSRLRAQECKVVARWAYGRTLLRTYISPAGRAPLRLFREFYATRTPTKSATIQIARIAGTSVHAGTHTSVRIGPDGASTDDLRYVAHVGLPLGRILFSVTFGEDTSAATFVKRFASSPRRWFPGSIAVLDPRNGTQLPELVLSRFDADCVALSMEIQTRGGIAQLGPRAIDFRGYLRDFEREFLALEAGNGKRRFEDP